MRAWAAWGLHRVGLIGPALKSTTGAWDQGCMGTEYVIQGDSGASEGGVCGCCWDALVVSLDCFQAVCGLLAK